MTRRALLLFVVVALLVVSYAGPLRAWVVQRQDLAVAQQQIAERSARVAELENELHRWQDPAFVRAQARERLGWVMPGETGYRVIGSDGEVLSGRAAIEGVGSEGHYGNNPRWWNRLEESLLTADDPGATP